MPVGHVVGGRPVASPSGDVSPAGIAAVICFSSLGRLVKSSRDERPSGSLHVFMSGDVAPSIRPITGRLSLFPHSFTRHPFGLPYGFLPDARGNDGLTVFRVSNRMRLGSLSAPVVFNVHEGDSCEIPFPPLRLLAQAYQHLWLVSSNGTLTKRSRMLTNVTHPSPLSPLMLGEIRISLRFSC